MLNILHIATQTPGYRSGGEIVTLQFSYALTRKSDNVDYIGPKIESEEIARWYHNTTYLDRSLNLLEKAWTLCHFQFDKKYVLWKKLNIDFNKYQVIFIEFTKLDYILHDILESGYCGKIIVRAHNVEKDFFNINFKSKKSLVNLIKYLFAEKRERFMVRNADLVLAITETDKMRILELYGVPSFKVDVCPVGVNIPEYHKKFEGKISKRMKCLITGSLWFGPNCDGTLWFIRKVYPIVKDYCELTVAGFRPNSEIKKRCMQEGIQLVDSPESMAPYFAQSEMVLAPIFDGGGMKVKIAEAMSYGLPIVTTSHGVIGYDVIHNKNCFVADNEQDFANAIHYYYALDDKKRREYLENEWKLYVDKYSLIAISNYCDVMIDKLSTIRN